MNQPDFEKLSIKDQLAMVNATSATGDHKCFQWLIQCHDPAKVKFHPSSELLQALEEQVVEEDFLDRFEVVPPESYPSEYVKMLRLLSRIDGQESAICKRSFLPNLAYLISTNSGNLDLLADACRIVGLLASVNPATRQGSIREAIAESGVIGEMAKLLRIHPSNSNLIMSICKSINNAVFIHVAGKLAFLQSGGFSYLVQLFERNDITIEAKRDAAMLLRAIVHLGDERLCLFEPGVPRSKSPLEDIVNIMGTSNDPVLQLHLIWAALNITINMGDAKRAFGKVGGMTAITNAVRHSQNNIQLEYAACIAYQQMATKTFNRVVIGKEDALNEVVSIMCKHRDNIEILNITLGVLDRVASQAICRKKLASVEILPRIMVTLGYHKQNIQAMFLAVNICHRLAQGANETKKAMRDNGILEFLSTVVGIHSNEPQFCSMAAAVSSAMLSNGEAEYEDEISTDETSESETSSDSGGYPSGDFDEIDIQPDLVGIKQSNEMQRLELQRCNSLTQHQKELQHKIRQEIEKLKNEESSDNSVELSVLELTQKNISLENTIKEKSEKMNTMEAEISKLKMQQKAIKKDLDQALSQKDSNKLQQQAKLEEYTTLIPQNEIKINKQAQILQRKDTANQQLHQATELVNATKQQMVEWMALAVKLDQMCAQGVAIDFDKEVIQKMMISNVEKALATTRKIVQ